MAHPTTPVQCATLAVMFLFKATAYACCLAKHHEGYMILVGITLLELLHALILWFKLNHYGLYEKRWSEQLAGSHSTSSVTQMQEPAELERACPEVTSEQPIEHIIG